MQTDEIDMLLVLAPSPGIGLNLGFDAQAMPPLGIGYIATYVSQFGYKVKLIDMSIPEETIYEVLDIVNNGNPKMIGISTTTETFNNGVLIAKTLKELNKDYLVFMGGPHVTFEYTDALNTNYIDVVIRGEGEIVTRKLCDFFIRQEGKIEEIKGISYKYKDQIISNPDSPLIQNLDDLPYPDRSFYDMNKYPHKGNCSTSRGCPGKCIFCAASGLSGGKYRMRSAESIVNEFRYLKSIGCHHIDIVDDTMTASLKRLDKILDLLLEENLGVTWYCESRVDVVSKELLIKMKQAGLSLIQFGVEAGSQEMLDCLKKQITLEQIENVFRWCRELDILATSNMIIGNPYDTEKSIDDTITLAKKILSYGAHMNFTICTPFPGTYMWDHMEELGIKIIENNLDKYTTFYPVLETSNFSANDLRNQYYKASLELLMHRKSEDVIKEKGLIRFNEQLLMASNFLRAQFKYYKVDNKNLIGGKL